MKQLSDLSTDGEHKGLPIFCTGDIFHKWNASPELINTLITHHPHIFAVPGNHDLPLHNMEDIRKSAFWTLKEAGLIDYLKPHKLYCPGSSSLWVMGFPYGTSLNVKEQVLGSVTLAICHKFCWKSSRDTPKPLQDVNNNVHTHALKLDKLGFTSAVFGDNHIPFNWNPSPDIKKLKGIFNNGTFMIRNSNERDYKPRVGLLMSDSTIEEHFLDTSADKYSEIEDPLGLLETDVPFEDFLNVLGGLSGSMSDFKEQCKTFCKVHDVPDSVTKVMTRILEKVYDNK